MISDLISNLALQPDIESGERNGDLLFYEGKISQVRLAKSPALDKNRLLIGQIEILEMISTGRCLDDVLNRIASLVEEVAGNLRCAIFLLEPEGKFLSAAASPGMPADFKESLQALPVGLEHGTCGASIQLKTTQISPDVTTDSRWVNYQDFALNYGVRASWSTPIFSVEQKVLGTIGILYEHLHDPEPYEVEFVNVATHLASIAIERARSEEKLRISEAKFRALTEKSSEGISLFGRDGKLIYTSPSAHRIHGYTSEEMLDCLAKTQVHPDDWPIVKQQANSIQSSPGASLTLQFRRKHKNGHWFWVEANLTNMLSEPGVEAMVLNFQDISARKHAEKDLLASEELYRSLVTALDEGIVTLDRNLTVLTCNVSAEKILGITPGQMPGMTSLAPVWQTVHEDGSEFPPETHPAAISLRTGQSCSNVILGVHRPNGSLVWLSVNSQPLFRQGEDTPYAVVASFTDITEHKLADAEMRASEERFSNVFHFNPCGLAILTFPEGRFVEANRVWLESQGYSLEEVIGRTSSELKLWRDQKLRDEMFELLLSGHTVVRELESSSLSKSGEPRYFVVSTEVIEFGGKKYVLDSCYDISERRLTEQKLERLYEQSRTLSARLESVREEERIRIAREIHDNLGQVLTGLKLDFSWLEKRLARSSDESLARKTGTKLKEIAQLLEEAIQTVRDIATELRPGILDTLGLRAAIHWKAKEFARRNGVNCAIELGRESGNLSDEKATALFRVFQEILTNITRHAKASKVKIELTELNGELLLTVSDNGVGITEEQRRNTKSLGLLGMRERVLIFGGGVTIKGEPRRGTTVQVKMPIENKPSGYAVLPG